MTGLGLRLARGPAGNALAGLAERSGARSHPALAVLTYHRVDDPRSRPELDPALLSATPEEFERQVAWVASRLQPLSLDDALAVRRGDAEAPPTAVLVTFDDAYCDFADNAWPVLRRHGVPATLFVATAHAADAGRQFWWDRLHAAFAASSRGEIDTSIGTIALNGRASRLAAHRHAARAIAARPHAEAMRLVEEIVSALGPADIAPAVLGWEELRRLAAEGVALAAHTRTHPRLDRLGVQDAVAEVRGSLADLDREVGTAPPAFAYPQGGHADPVVRALAGEGVELAFTTERGVNDLREPDWLRLRRINVGLRSSVGALRLQLAAARRLQARMVP